MPELPEVETVRRGAEACLRGKTLRAVTLRRLDLRWPIPMRAVRALAGRRLLRIERRAKYLLLRWSGPGAPVALVHLGMSGRLMVSPKRDSSELWLPHEHWRMDFGRLVLRYQDPRRFGALDVVAAERLAAHPLLGHLGPEPLGPGFDAERLWQRTRQRHTSIKALLMDAHEVVGVGNIYASEACFRAGVRPTRAAGRTTRAECARLVDAVRLVLRQAIRAGGTTLRDYIGVDGDSGYFQQRLAVYGRDGEPCRHCGAAVRRVVQGARASYYCPHCQR